MKTTFKNAAFFTTLFTILLWCTCSERLAGAGSETTNGIIGCVLNKDGTPAPFSNVKLFPSSYNPCKGTVLATSFTTITDNHGRFKFDKPDPGIYTVIARSQNNELQARIANIQVNPTDSVTKLANCNLTETGSLSINFSGTENFISCYCYLPGTDIYAIIDTNYQVLLSDVPTGIFDSLMFLSSLDTTPRVARYAVIVQPGDITIISNPGWKFTRTISFNTSATGADITDDLFNVPVLLRLNKDNFNFSETNGSGADLRFVTDIGKLVSFEIERWDETAQNAEVWLRIDTLRGNNTSQTISMYWGNEALSHVTNQIVFDTAAGFQGVWHLGENVNDSTGDATVNNFNGISPDSARPASVVGIIGKCRFFNGISSFITMPNTTKSRISFPQNSQYTVSAWVYVQKPDSLSHVILSKGNAQYFLWYTSIHLSSTLWEFADYRSESGWDLATARITAGEWVFIAGVHDGTSHMLYINGERVDTLIDYPFNVVRSDQSDLMIGRFAQFMASPTDDEGFCYFNGSIDEVQISSVARSAQWIKLSYQNQNKNDKLISFH